MTCPPEVAAILAEILKTGLLQIRNGSLGPEQMQAEADHLHNLPGLLVDFHAGCFEYYWRTERACYRDRIAPRQVSPAVAALWAELEPRVRAIRDTMDRDRPDDTR